jgi:anaerobic magnesium-protoporphyrin IX monomethyl ester cyclase
MKRGMMNTERRPDITFVFPVYDTLSMKMRAFTYGIGAAFIRAYLHERNIYTIQYLHDNYINISQTAREITALGADVVGFTCFDVTVYVCKLIAEAIKKIAPEITIVFGGPAAILSDRLILANNKCVDICCHGEGEATCYELLMKLKNKEDLSTVKGITYRSKGEILRTPARELINSGERNREIDIVPSPILSNLLPAVNIKDTGMITSRGCTYKCTFCTNTAIRGHRIRYHSVERIIEELKHISASSENTLRVTFYDDAFTLNIPRAKEICRRIIAEDFPKLIFDCYTRIDKADDELFSLFAEAGFLTVGFGLESASPRILNIIKKVRSTPAVNGDYSPENRFLETMKNNIQLAKSHGLKTQVSIICGLPSETKEDAEATVRFVDRLGVDNYLHNYLSVTNGTELAESCEDYGIKLKPSPFQLPLTTEYAYDVFSVEPLGHSFVHKYIRENSELDWNDLFFILGAENKVFPENTTISLILVDDPPADDVPLFSWLSTMINYSSTIFIVEKESDFENFKKRFESFAKGGLPLLGHVELRRVVDQDNDRVRYIKDALYPYFFCKDDPIHMFHILPFTNHDPGTDTDTVSVQNGLKLNKYIKIKKITSRETLAELIAMGGNESDGLDLYGPQLSKLDCLVLEKCRWSNRNCAACSLDKLIIRGNQVSPCYTGKPIGKVGDSYNLLKDAVEKIKKETEERRGCETCEIRDSCSRCIFLPEFLSEEEYCDTRIKNRSLAFLLEVPTIFQELKRQEELKPADVKHFRLVWKNKGKSLPPSLGLFPLPQKMVRLELNDRNFFFDTETLEFYPVSKKIKEVFRLYESGFRKKDVLAAQLAEMYNVSISTAVNTLETLVKKINSIIEKNV